MQNTFFYKKILTICKLNKFHIFFKFEKILKLPPKKSDIITLFYNIVYNMNK